LLHRYEIAYVPSLAALHHLRRQSPAESARDLLAFADPESAAGLGSLPYSQREVQAIARFAGRESTVFVGAAASESALKSADVSDYRVLHFATHALVDARLPSRSALVLAASAVEDGLLQPSEIYGLTLDSELVVLSACRSAGGRTSAAEGVLSLARAFMYAGARAVVGSQWDVDDRSSARLIEQFYDGLSRGKPAAAALRDAQLALAGRTPYVTAAHWAGFVVSGDPRAGPALQAREAANGRRLAMTVAGTLLGLMALTATVLGRRRAG
jgi:CHAT domain-containing protein